MQLTFALAQNQMNFQCIIQSGWNSVMQAKKTAHRNLANGELHTEIHHGEDEITVLAIWIFRSYSNWFVCFMNFGAPKLSAA